MKMCCIVIPSFHLEQSEGERRRTLPYFPQLLSPYTRFSFTVVLCSVGVDGALLMDCATGPLECMRVNKCVQCAHVPTFFPSSLYPPVFFFFSPKVLLATRLQSFLMLQLFWTCVSGHPHVVIFTYGYTHRHADTLSRPAEHSRHHSSVATVINYF